MKARGSEPSDELLRALGLDARAFALMFQRHADAVIGAELEPVRGHGALSALELRIKTARQ
ncbi:MAG: hypothetical protein AAFX94_20205 [Myxococcota bacterium]